MKETPTKTCFFVSPIGGDDSTERKRSDKLIKHVLAPVLLACGYAEPIRADKIAKPGTIPPQTYELLNAADLVIADLTGHNPNVFYETRHSTLNC